MLSWYRFTFLLFCHHCSDEAAAHLGVGLVPFGINPWACDDDATVNPAPPVVGVAWTFHELREKKLTNARWLLRFSGQIEFAFSNFIVRTSPIFTVTNISVSEDDPLARTNDDVKTTTVWAEAVVCSFWTDHLFCLNCNHVCNLLGQFFWKIVHSLCSFCLCFR